MDMDALQRALMDLPISPTIALADFDAVSAWACDDKDRYLWRSLRHMDIYGGSLEASMHKYRVDLVSQKTVSYSAAMLKPVLTGATVTALAEGQVTDRIFHTLWVPIKYGYLALWSPIAEDTQNFHLLQAKLSS
jgi:hypothetical protein